MPFLAKRRHKRARLWRGVGRCVTCVVCVHPGACAQLGVETAEVYILFFRPDLDDVQPNDEEDEEEEWEEATEGEAAALQQQAAQQ